MLGKIIDIISIFRSSAARTRYSETAALFLCIIVLGVAGYGLGRAGGRGLMMDFLTGGGRIVPLLYRPSFQHFRAAAMLGSEDEMKRLAGYYALLEGDSIDVDFLVERYRMERSVANRRTIVWVIGFSRDVPVAARACAGLYESAPREIRDEILRSLMRLDEGIYREFVSSRDGGGPEPRRR